MVKYCCRNSPEGLYPKFWSNSTLPEVKPHYDELMDGFPCTRKENVNSGRTGWGYISSSLTSSFCLLNPTRSRGRNRQDADFVHGYKRMEYDAGGEKIKWKSRKQTKGKRIKISWVSVKLLKIFRPVKISGCNSSWACFSFWCCSALHIIYLSLLQENERSYLPFERTLLFKPKAWLLKERFLKPQ